MRILILSANTGGGHNAAAASIADVFARRGVDCDVRDCLAFLSETASVFISWGHSYIYRRLPSLFGMAYYFEEKHPNQQIYDLMSLGAEKLYEEIRRQNYDAVICVHVFGAMMVTEAKARFGYAVPFYFVATDYTCSPGVCDIAPDMWFIPDRDLIGEFVACGVPAERQLVTGIPIRREFYYHIDRAEARRYLGLPKDQRVVLLCCGSMGAGHIERIAPEFERLLPSDTRLLIICGRNERTYQRLNEIAGEKTTVIGYTDEIAVYMAASDICVSKPGGLTTTELMASGLPAVLVLAVPGCETRNMEFLCSKSLAVGTEDWNDAIIQTVELLKDKQRLADMRERLRDLKMTNAAETMADHIIDAVIEFKAGAR